MQVAGFLHKSFSRALPQVHSGRMQSLFDAVSAGLAGAPLSLTGLGRCIRSQAKVKHAIKQIDRLLGNPHLQQERLAFYGHMARGIWRRERHPVVLVDWSHADDRKQLFILRASLVNDGRSVALFEAAHDRENCPQFQQQFLQTLFRLVPRHCRPVIITDAGFGRKWFAAVEALNWFYVGRIRNRECFAWPGKEDWRAVTLLYRGAKSKPEELGWMDMTRHRLRVRVVRYQRQPQGRVYHGRLGNRSADSRSKQCAKREREPWLLVSNLAAAWSTKTVVKLYALRMRIEEGFRDLKSIRFGIGLRLQGSRSPARLNVLLLIAAIMAFAIYLCGQHAKTVGMARSYQANTSLGNVLSLFSIGRQWLRRPEQLSGRTWRALEDKMMDAMITAHLLV